MDLKETKDTFLHLALYKCKEKSRILCLGSFVLAVLLFPILFYLETCLLIVRQYTIYHSFRYDYELLYTKALLFLHLTQGNNREMTFSHVFCTFPVNYQIIYLLKARQVDNHSEEYSLWPYIGQLQNI